MKKVLALLLTLVMAVSCLAGCGKADGKKDGSVSKVVMLYPGEETDAMSSFLNNQLNPRLRDELGIEIEMIYRGWDQYWEQKSIMLAANQEIDFYWDAMVDMATIYHDGGCMPIDDLLDEYGKDMLANQPADLYEGAKIDGKICFIPTAFGPSACVQQFVCLRQDLLEAVGMTEVKTPDDLYQFASAVKEQFPEIKGPADPLFRPLTRAFADENLSFLGSNDHIVFNEDTKKFQNFLETDAFKKLCEYNERMFAEGIYKDELCTTYGERDSRMQQGVYTWVEGSFGKENEIINSVRQNAPEAELVGYVLDPEKDRYVAYAGGATTDGIYISPTGKNQAGAIKFLNWMYSSTDNYNFCLYGPEGENYDIVDGRIVLKDPTFEGYFYEWMFRNSKLQLFPSTYPDELIEKARTWDDGTKVSGLSGFNFNNEEVKELVTATGEIIEKEFRPLASGFVSYADNYDRVMQELKDAGIDELIAEIQRQYDEFAAAN